MRKASIDRSTSQKRSELNARPGREALGGRRR